MIVRKTVLAAAAATLFVGLAFYCAGRFWHAPTDKYPQVQAVRAGGSEERKSAFPSPRAMPIDEEQKAALKSIFDNIVVAYSNCQYEAIEKWDDSLPQMVECVPDKDFKDVDSRFFHTLFYEPYGWRRPLRSYTSAQEFSAWAKTSLAATRLYGKIAWRRISSIDGASRFEALALKRLKGYREKFESEGRTDLVDAADAFIAEWIAHIESPNGFSRTEALFWMDYCRMWGYDAYANRQSWDYLRDKAISQGAHHLVRYGYTPKWIDELRKIPEKQ